MYKRIEIQIPLRAITILVISILFGGLFVPVYGDWYHETGDGDAPGPLPEEWNVIERGANFIRRQSTTDSSRYSWESALQWVEACCSNYAPYVYNDTEDYYQVRSGLIGARIYKSGYAEFWDPDMTEVRLWEETWEVQYYDKGKWKACDTYDPVYSVSEGETEINITVSFATDWPNSGERSFVVNYIFREGRSLKHEVIFTSHSSETYEFRVLQKWAGIVAAKVKHDKGEVEVSSAITLNSCQFRFLKEDGSLAIRENQWNMYYGYDETTHQFYVLENHNLKPVEIDVHAQGLKADFTFGNWTLTQDESLIIDPATYTTDNPTVDGDVWYEPPDYTKYTASGSFWIYYDATGPETVRAFIEWPVSPIPDDAVILDTVFKYNGLFISGDSDGHVHEMMATRPSTGGAQAVYNEAGQGTVYAAPGGFPEEGENKQVDLGASADADLKTMLTSGDWFAIGLQKDDEGSYGVAQIVSEDWENGAPVPKPTLYVVYYQPGLTFTRTILSTTTTDGTVCIYTVIQVVIDPLTTVTFTSITISETDLTSTTTCDTSVDSSTSSTTTCDTSVDSSTSSTTTCDTDTEVETETITVTTCETTCLTSEITETSCETETVTDTECETVCETSTVTEDTTITTCTTSVSTSETCTTSCETSTQTSETCTTTCETSEITETSCETTTITHTTECETTCETSTLTSETTTTTCSTDTSISTTTTSLSSTVTLLTFCSTITSPTSCTTILTTSTLSSTTSTCSTITWTETTTSVSTSVGS